MSGTESQPTKEEQGSISNEFQLEFWFILCCIFLIIYYIYKITRRISSIDDLPEDYKDLRLYGIVTDISDGDGFRFFHCPWLRSREYSSEDAMLYVRLTGIDAPEMKHGALPGQAFAQESKDFLRSLIQNKGIVIKVVGIDQYKRILAIAYIPKSILGPSFNRWFPIGKWFQMDFLYTIVNLEMVKKGYAEVYKGQDAMYDEYKSNLKILQNKAKKEKKGLWINPNHQSPMSYKKIHR